MPSAAEMVAHPAIHEDAWGQVVTGDPLPHLRPKPYDDARYNAMADEYFREVVEHHGDRASFINMLKLIDRSYCANARIS